MQRCLFLLLAALSILVSARPAAADLRIVTTTPDLAAVAIAIGGEHVHVTPLALPTQDPHFVDARPHLALDLARADLLVAIGLGLEVGWLPTLQTGSRNGEIQNGAKGFLDCSRFVHLLDIARAPVDRSMGDIHPTGNPHYMMDPRAAVLVASGMAEKMASLDPDHAAIYRNGAKAFNAEVDAARLRWEKRLGSLRGKSVVAYHRSFSYLADWLGLDVVEHLEPRPGIPPNPGHVAHVIALGKSKRVKLLIQEQYYPDSTSKLAAEKMGATLIRIRYAPDAQHGETYVQHLDTVMKQLAAAVQP